MSVSEEESQLIIHSSLVQVPKLLHYSIDLSSIELVLKNDKIEQKNTKQVDKKKKITF